jgi:crotonobetainyl-CoA:carnitine CoA-transferase CaiB-like acyl-CoA transferase
MNGSLKPLVGTRIISTAINVPGPVALARLCSLGASAVKVEPPGGDPLALACPSWYADLHQGVKVISLNLKVKENLKKFESILKESDLLLTSSRLGALDRLGLSWPMLSSRFLNLLQVAIIGHPPPNDQLPGHDLTYQATLGLVDPPLLPRTLVADLAGAERTISTVLSLILSRRQAKVAGLEIQENSAEFQERIAYVSLADAASAFALPLKYSLTGNNTLLGGLLPGYNLYKAKEGWVAVAALENHFLQRLVDESDFGEITHGNLANFFSKRTAHEWGTWAIENDLPIVEVKDRHS